MVESNDSNELNILLIGMMGVGKSTLINSLFNEETAKPAGFEKMQGETKTIKKYSKLINGKVINLFDTPGFGDQDVDIYSLSEQIQDLLCERKIKIHFIVYVNRSDLTRNFDFLRECFEIIKEFFKNEEIASNVLCVLTHEVLFETACKQKNKDFAIEKEKYISYFLDNLKNMNFEIFHENILFFDIEETKKNKFTEGFFEMVDFKYNYKNLRPLSFKEKVSFKKIEQIINKCLDKERDLFNKSLRIDLEEFNKQKSEKEIIEINCCFLGEGGVGKTSLISNLESEKVCKDICVTLDVLSKPIFFKKDAYKIYKVNLFDTYGQEVYHSLNSKPIKSADLIFLVYDLRDLLQCYDVCNSVDFLISDYLISLIKDNKKPEALLILLGNKLDLYKTAENESIIVKKVNLLVENVKNKLSFNREIFNFFISSLNYDRMGEILRSFLDKFDNKENKEMMKLELLPQISLNHNKTFRNKSKRTRTCCSIL